MDQTHNISLGGFSFVIENNAAKELSSYLAKVRQFLGASPDTDEILTDVEQRMAELLRVRMQNTEVVTSSDVAYLIQVMGQPEQYVDTETQEDIPSKKTKFSFSARRLYRDGEDEKIAGVLSGVSHYFQIDVTLLRIIYLLLLVANGILFLPSASFWVLLYIIFWVVVPKANTTTEKLEMKGVEANLDTISSFKIQSPLKQQWCRSQTDKKIAGVLGGLAVYYGIGSTPLRIGYLLFCLLLVATRSVGMLFPILLYLVLWYLLKKEKGDEEKEEKRDLVKEKEVKPHKKFFFWSFFGILFKVIGYFIATIFFVCLFLILVTGLLSIFGVGVAGGITSVFLLDYLPFVFSPIEQVLFYVIWGMVFVLFFSVLVLFCYKIFSKGHYNTPKAWFLANVLLFVLPLLGGIAFASSVGRKFVSNNTVENKIVIDSDTDTLFLNEKKTASFSTMNIDSAGNGVSGEVHFIGIYPTQEAHPFLLISTSSQGKNTDDAQLHAQNIDFPLEIKDNQLWIPDGYFLQKGKPYRFQRVNIRLFVPKGKKVVSYSMISKRRGLGLPNGTFQVENDSIIKL
ncbi:MAG: PspC domain-containing protein [Capnocytophaga gingivalis]